MAQVGESCLDARKLLIFLHSLTRAMRECLEENLRNCALGLLL